MVFFFFSSRRRHTRSLRDWSSDVCSSDLGLQRLAPGGEVLLGVAGGPPHPRALVEDLNRGRAELLAALDRRGHPAGGGDMGADQHERSEERRVGKGWR